MRKPYVRIEPKLYLAGTHPRDIRKLVEKGEGVSQSGIVKKSQEKKGSSKTKKVHKKLKISTKK